MRTRQWEGEVERGSFGLRVGGDDLDLAELLESGSTVRVTVSWPDEDAEGRPLFRIMAPSVGTLPGRRAAEDDEKGGVE